MLQRGSVPPNTQKPSAQPVAFSLSRHRGVCRFLRGFQFGATCLGAARAPAAQHPPHRCSPSPRRGDGEKPAPRDLPTTSWRTGFPPANLRLLLSFYFFLLPYIQPELSPFRRSVSCRRKHLPSQHLQPFPPNWAAPEARMQAATFWQNRKDLA